MLLPREPSRPSRPLVAISARLARILKGILLQHGHGAQEVRLKLILERT